MNDDKDSFGLYSILKGVVLQIVLLVSECRLFGKWYLVIERRRSVQLLSFHHLSDALWPFGFGYLRELFSVSLKGLVYSYLPQIFIDVIFVLHW